MKGPPDGPALARWLVRLLAPEPFREAIVGDLEEEFRGRAVRSRWRARLWYWSQLLSLDVLRLRRAGAFRESSSSSSRSSTLPGRGRTPMLDRLQRDLRHALRSLRRNPGYTAVAVATLAVGIGASTAIFSVVQGVLLSPLSYPEPDRIVTVAETTPDIDIEPMWVSVPNWADYRDGVAAVSDLSLFRGRSMSFTGGDDPLYVYGAFATAGFFRVFDVPPAHGRTFTDEEIGPDPASVVVLGNELWRRRFGGDPDVVGETVEIDGTPRTVVGIMPAGFDAPGEWIAPTVRVELWIPFPLEVAPEERNDRSFHAVGRLRDGATFEAARAELEAVGARLRAEYPDANRQWDVQLLHWHELIVGDVRTAMNLLWIAVSLVLLVACTNVASLLLARLLGSRQELAVRKALGASRWRLVQGTVTESLLLSLIGGALGVVLAAGGLRLMLRFEPGALPLTHRIDVDGGVLLAALGTSLATGVLFGAVPGWFATGRSVAAAAQDAGGRTVAGGRQWLRTTLTGAQVALAFAIVVGAALVGRSFLRLASVPPGIEADRVMTATVALSWNRVDMLWQRSRFIRDVVDRMERIRGVESAAEINSLPLSGSNSWSTVWIDGRPADDPSQQPVAAFRNVTPGYLETMGIPMLRGRWLTEGDMEEVEAAVINRSFADSYFPGVDPVGRAVGVDDGETMLRVVGILSDVRHFGLDTGARPEIYLPYTVDWLTSKTFVARTSGDPATLGPAMREAIVSVDPDQPLRDLRTMSAVIADTTAGPRFNALMMSVAAAIALALAALGLFGTVSYAVADRRPEFGVRLALGSSPSRLVRGVVARGLRTATAGIVAGALLALAGTRVIQGLLFGLGATDPLTWGGVACVFVLVAALASWLPAVRASRVDPAVVLRER